MKTVGDLTDLIPSFLVLFCVLFAIGMDACVQHGRDMETVCKRKCEPHQPNGYYEDYWGDLHCLCKLP